MEAFFLRLVGGQGQLAAQFLHHLDDLSARCKGTAGPWVASLCEEAAGGEGSAHRVQTSLCDVMSCWGNPGGGRKEAVAPDTLTRKAASYAFTSSGER